MRSRIHDNPVLGVKTEFIELFEETNGKRTVTESVVQPGKGVPLHYHLDCTEYYEVLDGELSMQLGKEIKTLKKGEYLLVPKKTNHRYFNDSNGPVKFKAVIQPGNFGSQLLITTLNGLARDGKVNRKGLPKSLLLFAYLSVAAGSNIPGFMSFLQPLLKWLYKRAVSKGIEKELLAKYYV
jgi:mannose-6-phosphate isomerase-like protein (cupin superfamily)